MNFLKKLGLTAWENRRAIAQVAAEFNVPGAQTAAQIVEAIHADPQQPNDNATKAVAKLIDLKK